VALADRLNKSIAEVESWPEEHVLEFFAYYKISKGNG
jgi:hypothetical protein